MKRTLVVTMEVDVTDYSAAERKEFAREGDCKPSELPGARDADPFDVADAIAESLPINEEIFAGSMLYVKIASAKPTKAAWKAAQPQRQQHQRTVGSR